MHVGDFAAINQASMNNSSQLQSVDLNNSLLDSSTRMVGGLDEDNLTKLDQMLSQEEEQTGKKVFKRGQALRHGLIDVQGVLSVIKEQQADLAQVPVGLGAANMTSI